MSEMLSGGPERPPSRRGVLLAGAAVLAGGAVLGIPLLRGREPSAPGPPSAAASTLPPRVGTGSVDGVQRDGGSGRPGRGPKVVEPPGLLLRRPDGRRAGSLRRIVDEEAGDGAWTQVVRRMKGGGLGRSGAVITFPVPGDLLPENVREGSVVGHFAAGHLQWALDGSWASVRGDLSRREAIALAAATGVEDGVPHVRVAELPDGLTAALPQPYYPQVVNEARYGAVELGEAVVLGKGLVYTRVMACGGFEDRLFTGGLTPSGRVRGAPAAVTTAQGGNAELVWEPRTGVVAALGYSGASWSAAAEAALLRLAAGARLLEPPEWKALHPAVERRPNNL